MGEILAVLFLIFALLVWYFWLEHEISKLKTRMHMLDDVYTRKENAAAAVRVLEGTIRKLNFVCQDLQKRLDILESGHPDSEIDYGTTDGHDNIVEVWVDGKKYILEDKPDGDVMKLYADNKVVAETTRPESRYTCADCVRFRRERVDGKWRGVCSVDNVAMSGDELYICDKFRLYRPTEYYVNKNMAETTKSEVDHWHTQYKNMGGNGRAEEEAKYIVKLNYLASDAECDELLKRVERLNRIYDAGLMSLSEYGERLKEWMQK